MMSEKRIAISAFLDSQPRFFMQAWNWLNLLDACGTPSRADIILHHVPDVDPTILAAMKRAGAKTVEVPPFGFGKAAYCNKIQQLTSGACVGYERVVLSDLDVAFLECPAFLSLRSEVSAKTVDAPNPPIEILNALVASAGMTSRVVRTNLELFPTELSLTGNCNGGLYVFSGKVAEWFGPVWSRWARFCLERADLLARWAHHADQLGFMFSLIETNTSLSPLEPGANFPVHFSEDILKRAKERVLTSLHYHDRLDAHGLIRATGLPWIDQAILRANETVMRGRREAFDNQIFWDHRYTNDPTLGSGIGSRGSVLEYKRSLLLPFAKLFGGGDVLDVGCGDLEVTRSLPFRSYVGVDVSSSAIEIAKAKRPDWTFKMADLPAMADRSFDAVICLDVLIHQQSRDEYKELLRHLLRIAKNAVIVSGYPGNSDASSGIVFFHGDIKADVEALPDVLDVSHIGHYRGLDVILAQKGPCMSTNAHHIDCLGLARGCQLTEDWELFLELVSLSKKRLGFFPKTVVRAIEYPWFARQLRDEQRGRILDLGAGVSVLPFWLAEAGWNVATVDLHQTNRTKEPQSGWNEWGFLDYSTMDQRIVSHNLDAALFQPQEQFDAVYSVSVIEHMPATMRRAVLSRMHSWLKEGGQVLLSVDLVPGTDLLWRWSEGVEVDPEHLHGTFTDLLQEISEAKIKVCSTDFRRGIPGSRTDLAFIVGRA